MEKLKLDLPLLLPNLDDDDQRIHLLTRQLTETKGVAKAHIVRQNGPARLCLHYNPNLVPRSRLRRIARDAGVSLIPSPGASAEKGRHHEAHHHGSAPAFLPHWMQKRWTLILVILAGLFLLIGWLGETFFGLPAQAASGFYLLTYLTGGFDIATHAVPGLFKGKFDTDVLMLAAAGGAALLGQWAEGAFLLFLFSLGHAGEHYALNRARSAVNELGELMPKTARVKRNKQIVEAPVDSLQIGDVAVVRPGDRLPVDGVIIAGRSAIDQSAITGESAPVEKGVGDEVFAGSINQDAALDVEVTTLSKDNTLSRVMHLVAEAQSQQSPTQQFTQRFTAWFVPSVLIGVALVTAVPPLAGWMSLQQSFYRAMLLLVAASPCALALGTPATVLAGIAQAARNGVLVKGGVYLENLGALKVIAFDKTGTLTQGKFSLTDAIPFGNHTRRNLLRTAAAVEQQSAHPLALAVTAAAQAENLALPKVEGLENVAGRGVRSVINGETVAVGSFKLFDAEQGGNLSSVYKPADDEDARELFNIVRQLEMEGKTTMLVRRGAQFMGVLALADTPRPGVKETLRTLAGLGIRKLVILTGDNRTVAQKIGNATGVNDVRSELLPEHKLDAVKALQQEYGHIAMVGDGVNDAPALAAATVGIAMGGAGTAVVLETSDVALMADDLSKLPFAVGLSRASRAIIKQNLAISLGVIGVLIVTSVLGLAQLGGTVIVHEGSTLVVVLNALRLLRYRGPKAAGV